MPAALVKAIVEGNPSSDKTTNTFFQPLTAAAGVAGNTIVAFFVFDNAAVASKPIISSIGKPAGETANWVFLGAARSTSTSAGAFSSGELWAIKTTVTWPIANYTITFDTTLTMKSTNWYEFSGVEALARSTAGTAYSTTTTAASATTAGTTPVIGDLVLGLIFQSNSVAVPAGDTDTTGGAWVTAGTGAVGSTGGSAATNNTGRCLYKVTTATSQQTLNNSAVLTAGNGAIVAVLQAALDPLITQASYRFYADGTESGSVALAAQDTSYTADVTSGDVNLLVRTRLQLTNAGVINATDDWQLQWEKNASGTWTNVGPTLVDSYTEENRDNQQNLGDQVNFAVGQSFRGNGGPLSQAAFCLLKNGSPNAGFLLSAQLFAHTGTYGSGGLPTGTALATSTNTVSASILGTSTPGTWFTFDFDGTFTLTNTTPYFITLQATGLTGDSSNKVWVSCDLSSPTHSGNAAILAAGWSAPAATDLMFKVSGPPTVIGYDSANLTDGAVTTNRLGAGTGSFVAGKVSEDGLVDDLGWTANNYTEVLYSTTLKAAALVNSDTLRFRVLRNGVTAGMTYTQTPTISITKAVVGGQPKVYLAGAFTKKPLKVYSGSAFVEKPVKVWTGSAWKTLA